MTERLPLPIRRAGMEMEGMNEEEKHEALGAARITLDERKPCEWDGEIIPAEPVCHVVRRRCTDHMRRGTVPRREGIR